MRPFGCPSPSAVKWNPLSFQASEGTVPVLVIPLFPTATPGPVAEVSLVPDDGILGANPKLIPLMSWPVDVGFARRSERIMVRLSAPVSKLTDAFSAPSRADAPEGVAKVYVFAVALNASKLAHPIVVNENFPAIEQGSVH
jgi:hypothetical protein